MVLIADLVKAGLRCPNCGGVDIRGGHHDFQSMDSFICETCGFRWQEDAENLLDVTDMFSKRRFVWSLVDTDYPLVPLLNSDSADGQHDRDNFVSKGLKEAKRQQKKYLRRRKK